MTSNTISPLSEPELAQINAELTLIRLPSIGYTVGIVTQKILISYTRD